MQAAAARAARTARTAPQRDGGGPGAMINRGANATQGPSQRNEVTTASASPVTGGLGLVAAADTLVANAGALLWVNTKW